MKIIVFTLAALLPFAAFADRPTPVTDADYNSVNLEEAKLGQLLFWDPILSGNRNISCGTCHHPKFGTGDGVSLSFGDGGMGLGPERRIDPENPPEQRIPRNAPALFNLGAKEFTVMFHDGRLEADSNRPSGLRTPLEDEMVMGFDNVLSAQTMFPVLSADEMAGHYSENEISRAVRQGRLTGSGGAWDLIAKRVASLPAYTDAFRALDPEIAAGRAIDFTDISNAIAAFIAHEWRSDTSPFDAYLNGTPLPVDAQMGADLFYGEAKCADCHAGPFLTDHDFHAMGDPQIGPGKAARFENHSQDTGRMRVTGNAADAYAFRTPSLRNVTKTGPWGHAGATRDLGTYLQNHTSGAAPYDRSQPIFPIGTVQKPDFAALDDPKEVSAIEAAATSQSTLTDADITALLAFLDTLTDENALRGRLGIPNTVPSGLPVDR